MKKTPPPQKKSQQIPNMNYINIWRNNGVGIYNESMFIRFTVIQQI